MKALFKLRAVSFFSMACLAGCALQPPIATTLTDLNAESNDYSVDPMVKFHENLSINGLLLQPQVGAHWYTSHAGIFDRVFLKARSSPAFAIGISAKLEQPSFALYGETKTEVTLDAVNAVKQDIESVQGATAIAIRQTAAIATARAQIQNIATDKNLSAADKTAKTDALKKAIDDATAEKDKNDAALTAAVAKYRTDVAAHSGIIVARWTRKDSAGASASSGIFDFSGSKETTLSGYLILGGIRISTFYFGDDFRSYVNMIENKDSRFFDQLGITTYLIQTHALAWTSSLDLQQAFSGSLSLKVSSFSDVQDLLSDMDKITIAGYASTAMNLDNTGSLDHIQWYRQNRPMVDYMEITGPKPAELTAVDGFRWVQVKPHDTFDMAETKSNKNSTTEPQKLESGDWLTVEAVTAKAPAVYKAFRDAEKSVQPPRIRKVGERQFMLIDNSVPREVQPAETK